MPGRKLTIVRDAFEGTAQGDGRAFIDMLADDVEWRIIGTTDWSQTFVGKSDVITKLLKPLSGQFDGLNQVVADRVFDAGTAVIVEGHNRSRTKAGEAYPNEYCWIMEFCDQKVSRIVEYCDTALVERVLEYSVSSLVME